MIHKIIITLIAAIINLILSLLVPVLLKNAELPILKRIKHHFINNRNGIIISTITVIIYVYVSLSISKDVQKILYKNISELNPDTQVYIKKIF